MKINDRLDSIPIKTDYKKSGIQCCLDPFRNKLVPANKEEIIRQKIALFFRDVLKVTAHLIFTEDSLCHWGADSNDRADIIIGYENKGYIYPLAIVECKAPDVNLSSQTYSQGMRYINSINGKYLFITNGIDILAWMIDDNSTKELSDLPSYVDMLNDKVKIYEPCQYEYQRLSLEEISQMTDDEYLDTGFIGEDTPEHLRKYIVNLGECLYDTQRKISSQIFNGIKLVEDLGLSVLNYGDASGSSFGSGTYRSLLIEDSNGSNQVISFGIMATGKTVNDPKYGNCEGKSVLVVSLQEFKTDYTVVQINLNKFLKLENDTLTLWHNGAVMQKGAKKEELLGRVQKQDSSLIRNGKIYLGTLPVKELMYMDSETISNLICNIITYSMIRDEYKQSISLKKGS